MKFKILVLFFICATSHKALAQSGTGAAGGDASSTRGSVSYTIGLVGYSNYTTSSGQVTEGIQQPYEIFSLGSSRSEGVNANKINLKTTVHPNPTADYIILDIGNTPLQSMSYTLCDINGKLLSTKSLSESQTKIQMKSMSNATYFINVFAGNDKVRSFKIIKN